MLGGHVAPCWSDGVVPVRVPAPPVTARIRVLPSMGWEQGHRCILFRAARCKPLSAAAQTGGPVPAAPPTPALCSPEAAHELSEARPLTGVVVPAAGHEGIEDRWAEVGLGEPVALLQHPDDILVLQPEEGLLAEAQYLPHAHG